MTYGPTGESFVPEAPYDDYAHGEIWCDTEKNRKYVSLKKRKVAFPKRPNRTTYARYLFQVDLWKRTQQLIPDELEVDHINDDVSDDRLDNYQLLTKAENARKRDFYRYRNYDITQELLDTVGGLLESGQSRQAVAHVVKESVGFIRFLINEYLPIYRQDAYIERNVDLIRTMLEGGHTQENVADELGVDQATISRLVSKHLDHLQRKSTIARRRDMIKHHLDQGLHYTDIAPLVGCTPLNVWYYIKKFFPECREQWDVDKAAAEAQTEDTMRQTVERALNTHPELSHMQIAKLVGMKQQTFSHYVRKFFPERAPGKRMEALVAKAKNMITNGADKEAILKATGLGRNQVTLMMDPRRRKAPEHVDYHLSRRKCKEYLDGGLSYKDAAAVLNVDPAAVINWTKEYFPEHSPIYRWARRICTDPQVEGVNNVILAAKAIVDMRVNTLDELAKELLLPRRYVHKFYHDAQSYVVS